MIELPFLLITGLMLCAFFTVGYASQRLRFPSVLAYILIGAAVSFWFAKNPLLHLASEVGIVLMFFVLGLEFPLARMVAISKKIWPSGLLDVLFNFCGTFAIAWSFGCDPMTAFMVGSVAYATSSSMSAKMLDEQKRLAHPETEFILALLIFEDLVAPILVSVMAGADVGEGFTPITLLVLLLKLVGLTAGAMAFGLYGFRRAASFVERHIDDDFMPLFSVGIALGYAGLAVFLGLSEILGAFLAGMMLSETGRSRELEHLSLPVRDLCLPFFFFGFGMSIRFEEGISDLGLMLMLILWAVMGKLVSVYVGGILFGLRPKHACRAACSMVHRGEFSAVIASLAPPSWRVFGGIYILATAGIGILLFGKAPSIANWFDGQRKRLNTPKRSERSSKSMIRGGNVSKE